MLTARRGCISGPKWLIRGREDLELGDGVWGLRGRQVGSRAARGPIVRRLVSRWQVERLTTEAIKKDGLHPAPSFHKSCPSRGHSSLPPYVG